MHKHTHLHARTRAHTRTQTQIKLFYRIVVFNRNCRGWRNAETFLNFLGNSGLQNTRFFNIRPDNRRLPEGSARQSGPGFFKSGCCRCRRMFQHVGKAETRAEICARSRGRQPLPGPTAAFVTASPLPPIPHLNKWRMRVAPRRCETSFTCANLIRVRSLNL